MPVEFAAAAGRFGHSMVRPFYHPWSDPLSWTTVTVEDFIRFSHANSLDRLEGGVSFHWSTDWRRMFDFSDAGRAGGEAPVPISAMAIDTHLAPQLHELPSRLRSDMADAVRSGRTFSLAASTMNRGRELGLASAQRALKLANPLLDTPIPAIDAEDIFEVESGLADIQKAFPELRAATPLWFYLLREAELLAGGTRLGPFGGRIVMETLHAAIDASKDSILRGDWRLVLPSRAVGRYEMTDLIEFSAGATP
jgi:hypothetical protein